MGYELQAVIAEESLLRAVARGLAGAGVASLGQGPALMAMTDRLFDAVTDGGSSGPLGFRQLPGGFEHHAAVRPK